MCKGAHFCSVVGYGTSHIASGEANPQGPGKEQLLDSAYTQAVARKGRQLQELV